MRRVQIGKNARWTVCRKSKYALATALVLVIAFLGASAAAQQRPSLRCDNAEPAPLATERRIVVSIPDRQIAVVENGRVVLKFRVSVGAPASPSPAGEFRVVNRVTNPVYYHPGEVISPGPVNPVGPRWIGLNIKGYGIHGTNEPHLIGRNVSHGCIRLRNRDVKVLFAHVRVGDAVELHATRDAETTELFGTSLPPVLRASANEAKAEISAQTNFR
ncbi:MAG TPA: L,D-transpeptidase [Candidatus Acidoferrales bacterium]|nr:L,D-transpeptidase [Candidatus Acidoferrales bacterium]